MGWTQPQHIVITGLSVVMILFIVLSVLVLSRLQNVENGLQSVARKHAVQSVQANLMRQAARERSIVLHRMVATIDPFERDEQYLQFKALGEQFLLARNELVKDHLQPDEVDLLEQQRTHSGIAVAHQQTIVDLLATDQLEAARQLLINDAIPAQDRVLQTLDDFVALQVKHNAAEVHQARKNYRTTIRDITIMAGLALCVVAMVGWQVTRRVSQIMRRLNDTSQRLSESAKRERAIRDNMLDALIVSDATGTILSCNPAAESMLGYEPNELHGRKLDELMPGHHGDRHGAYMKRYMETGEKRIIGLGREDQARRKDGSLVDIEVGVAQVEREGETLFIGLLHDITARKQVERGLNEAKEQLEQKVAERTRELEAEIEERKRIEKRLETLATHDPLTGLDNRLQFDARLAQALAHGKRHQAPFALLYLDLDGFKPVNDTLGHQAGDKLLQEIAQRLRGCVREEDALARIGGDEFAILVPMTRDEEALGTVARKLIDAVSSDVALDGRTVRIGVSIGISRYPVDGEDGETLLQRADEAMYRAKQDGKNRHHFVDPPQTDELTG